MKMVAIDDKPDRVHVGFYEEPEVVELIDLLASQNQRTRSGEIRQAIRDHIERQAA